MVTIFPYVELPSADLIIDAVYEGKKSINIGGEPLSHLMTGIGNQGGFRAAHGEEDEKLVVLYSSQEDQDWPDHLDLNTGQFSYYGDNKSPGRELHDTARGGNHILRRVFDFLHSDPPERERIPPFFVFTKYPTTVSARSVQFRGLAVPGSPDIPSTEDLIAVWKTTDRQRFQNYRAYFTILDIPQVSRAWIDHLTLGVKNSQMAPAEWKEWCDKGVYKVLESESTINFRKPEEQIPQSEVQREILDVVWKHFDGKPTAFEYFSAWLYSIHDQRVEIGRITRPSRDGGRDAVGRYRIGLKDDPVYAEFSLEAKCYRPPSKGKTGNSVKVRDVARLISRLRHREFGVLVTTSYIVKQAYEEVRKDRHPIIFISGGDIVEILTSAGFSDASSVKAKLERDFPH